MTIEEKIMIADYLGWIRVDESGDYMVPNLYPITPNETHELSTGSIQEHISHVEFDTRMDYMMPVLEKIRSEGYVITTRMLYNYQDKCVAEIAGMTPDTLMKAFGNEEETLIDAIGKVIIQFLKWRQSNK